MPGRCHIKKPRLIAIIGLTLVASLLPSSPAWTSPKAPEFGPAIDTLSYEGQEKCSPNPKPGVVAFQQMVLRAYPGTGVGSISRACDVGGTSEHKEGRAWDWSVSAASATDRRKVDDLLEWLLKEDKYGNEAAMARRLGVMYVIWNKRIWGSWGGWETYCVMKNGSCRDPEDKTVLSPHTDHVHFSFTWAGAKKKTTWWNPSWSFAAAFAPTPTGNGYWVAARNGAVLLWGSAGYYGSKEGNLREPVVDMAATPSGGGYWLVTRNGRVLALGDARYRGKTDGNRRIVGITPTETGKGYWVASRSGHVQAFGDAEKLGSLTEEDLTVVDIASTPTGLGYWLFTDRGRVFTFGDAQMLGGAADADLTSPIVAADNNGADGYWMVTDTGRVLPFGTAHFFGGASDKKLDAPIAAIAGSALGDGYWLMTTKGRVFAYGEVSLAPQRSAPGRTPQPAVVESSER